jgi:hypothetical protein
MKLDTAVIKLLGIDPETTSLSSAGGGGCSSASTSKIVSKTEDGVEQSFFMKTGAGKDAEVMFAGISQTVPHRGARQLMLTFGLEASTSLLMHFITLYHHYAHNRLAMDASSPSLIHHSL